jgi:hypothetical protein
VMMLFIELSCRTRSIPIRNKCGSRSAPVADLSDTLGYKTRLVG